MKKYIMELFGFQGLLLDRLEVKEDILVYGRSPRTQTRCPHCNCSSKRVHQVKNRLINFGRFNQKKLKLVLKVRRFWCHQCGQTFTEPHPEGITRSRYSESVKLEAVDSLKHTNFAEVKKRYGLSQKPLLDFLSAIKQEQTWPEGKLKLNIDEHSFSGRDLKISIGLASHHQLKDILKDDHQATLITYLAAIPPLVKPRISEVCIDLKFGYLQAIKQTLPQTLIVADRFHVMREMLRQIDETRRIIQPLGQRNFRRIPKLLLLKNANKLSEKEKQKLKQIWQEFKLWPILYRTWWVKEQVRLMYESHSRAEAEKKLEQLLLQLADEPIGKLREMRDTLIRWQPYILNFFVSGLTNAFIEGCHNKIKLVKRMSYGFRNFNNYVLKVTLAFLPFLFLY